MAEGGLLGDLLEGLSWDLLKPAYKIHRFICWAPFDFWSWETIGEGLGGLAEGGFPKGFAAGFPGGPLEPRPLGPLGTLLARFWRV